jgi:hypothetical protein
MNAFTKQFRELWEIGGPLAAGMGVISIVFLEEGIRFLYYGKSSDAVATMQISNTVPFFIQAYGVLVLGVSFLVVCLIYYFKMKTLELQKDKEAIKVLSENIKAICKMLEKTKPDELVGELNLIKATVQTGNKLLEKIIEKNYVT